MLRRDTALRYLPGVGPRRAEKLASAGVRTVGDLLLHLPSRYEDRRHVVDVDRVDAPGTWTVRGRLAELRLIRTRRRGFVIVRGRLLGERGTLTLTWFNQPYLLQRHADGDEVILHGQVRPLGETQLELVNPTIDPIAGESEVGRVVPVYPAIGGAGPGQVARWVRESLPLLRSDPPPELLPEQLRHRYALPDLATTLSQLHAPRPDSDLEALSRGESPFHYRMVYEELFLLQLELVALRRREIREPKRHRYRIDDRARSVARSVLPFALTTAQKRAIRQIVDELKSPFPMLRLLQGDVGSGKTIVAAMALLLAAESGLQGAFMAPTELLAEQHFGNLERLLGKHYRVGLFTSSTVDPRSRAELADGSIQIAVGTHALIQEGLHFSRLGLAIVDEQHRFGVEQRRLLQGKGDRPDVLVMTATPIPRSLALTLYGDLEVSVLDELPPGRVPIATEVLPGSRRGDVYRRLRADLADGAQAYVVFPLIEESDEVSAASLARLGDRVREFLSDFPSAVLHGRMPVAERERIHRAFANGEVRVLVATTVIEVGIDVPAATWMVIESAERFGLAQLHQLRGRVGRGSRASRCVALHGRLSDTARRRLATFAETADGFAIAEADLELRGPGDLLGKRQAGLPSLRFANLISHRTWLERARGDAQEWIDRLDEPALAPLAARLQRIASDRYQALAGG